MYITPIIPGEHRYPTITPFTIADGQTYLNTLEHLVKMMKDIIDNVNENNEELYTFVVGVLNTKINEINDALDNQETSVDAKLSTLETLVNETDSELRTYVDDQVSSIINSSVEIQDPVAAALVNDDSSQLRNALDNHYLSATALQASLPFANIADFGAVCDGATDDSQAIRDALDAIVDGGIVTAPSGVTIASSGVVVDKPASLDFGSNTFIQTANAPVFTLLGEYENIQQCAVTENIVTVLDATAYAVGDVVKIVSDDENHTARPTSTASKSRLGSHYEIISISGDTLTLDRVPILPLTTNPRIGKMVERHISLEVENIYCEQEDQSAFTAHSVVARALVTPNINVTVTRGGGAGVSVESCYRANVNAKVSNLLDQPGVHNGYGVQDIASTFSNIYIDAHRTRHAFTEGTPNTIPGNNDLANYGYSEKALIRGRSTGSYNSAFDTHHGGFYHIFESVTVTGSTGSAFGLRGTGHQVNNPNVDTFRGVNVFYESASPSVTKKHIINGGYFRVDEAMSVSEHPDHFDESETLTVVGTVFEIKSRILYTDHANVQFVSPTFITYETTKPPMLINLYGGRLTGSFTFTAKNVVDGTPSVFANVGSMPAHVDVDAHIDITEEYSDLLTEFAWASSSRFAARITGTKYVGELRGNLNDHRQAITTRHSDTVESSAMIETPIVSGSSLPQPKSSDPVVFMVVTMPSNNSMNYAQPGAFAGQMMIVQNSTESGGNLIINTTGNILVDEMTTIPPGDSVLLMFNGTNWRKMTFK